MSELVTKALHIIWDHRHRRNSVEGIARDLKVNRRTPERQFREQLGRTVLQELIACRLERAKRLLRGTQLSIKYVAFAAGFSSQSNLCKVFQHELNMSPSEFRENRIQTECRKSTTDIVPPPAALGYLYL